MTEWEVEKQILEYLAHKGCCVWPTHGPRNHPAAPGVPDIIGADRAGRLIAIEVKADGGVVSGVQAKFHAALLRNGALVLVARSLDDVMGVEL